MTDARASGSGEPGFDEIYARAGSDLNAIPWAALAPQPALVAWLDRQDRPSPPGRTFTAAGLRKTEWIDEATGSTSGRRTFTAVYAHP